MSDDYCQCIHTHIIQIFLWTTLQKPMLEPHVDYRLMDNLTRGRGRQLAHLYCLVSLIWSWHLYTFCWYWMNNEYIIKHILLFIDGFFSVVIAASEQAMSIQSASNQFIELESYPFLSIPAVLMSWNIIWVIETSFIKNNFSLLHLNQSTCWQNLIT